MSCSGLHCGGCAGGAAVPVVPLLAVYGVAWVAEHVVEVLATSAVCGALAVAAVIWLMRWSDRRDAVRRAAWELRYIREKPQIRTARSDLPPAPDRAALPFRDLHIHIDGVPTTEHAAVIRQALNGRTSQS
jgi:hypothetical protein